MREAPVAAAVGNLGEIVAACRNGIVQAAAAFDPVRVDAFAAGGLHKLGDGGQVARVAVRIVYDREGGHETREATVSCSLDAGGTVVSIA